ncbi:MAG TPA: class I SAM-dependent methyltransferase [Longimicrobium sp.]|jgi:protein arginine N-methyltransferase 1|nr:class I SAM-dependent methyltransferase [Longimicrobium sp.]
MYSLWEYCLMIEDPVRTEAYLAALRQAVTPGSVVVEIGTGTGFFAVMAVRMGARRVYAIEADAAIAAAREVARLNGCADRIEFIEAMSTEATLPEQGDVLLSDLRGVLPAHQFHIPSIAEARVRLLKPGGVQIPQEDVLWMALLESDEASTDHLRNRDPAPHGVDFAPVHRRLAHTWRKRRVQAEELISAPAVWGRLDYRTVVDPTVRGTAKLTATRDGVVHGVSAWFEACLLPGIGFSNAPGSAEAIYGQAYFPFPAAVGVREGEEIEVTLEGRLAGSEYLWRWRAHGRDGLDDAWSCDQSTFFSTPLDAEALRRHAPSFVPRVNGAGKLDAWILSQMDASRSVQAIAAEAAGRFPDQLKSLSEALGRVGDLAERYADRASG